MPTFNVKDLTINIADAAWRTDLRKVCPKAITKLDCGLWLTPLPRCPVLSKCPNNSKWCGGFSVDCLISPDPCRGTGCCRSEYVVIDIRDLVINPEQIKDIRADLDVLLNAATSFSSIAKDAVKLELDQAMKQM